MSPAEGVRRLRRRLTVHHAYQAMFNTPEGQEVLRDLLKAGGVLKVSHSLDGAETTAFNDGKRALALHVLNRLRWTEGELIALSQQRTERQIEWEDE